MAKAGSAHLGEGGADLSQGQLSSSALKYWPLSGLLTSVQEGEHSTFVYEPSCHRFPSSLDQEVLQLGDSTDFWKHYIWLIKNYLCCNYKRNLVSRIFIAIST